MVLSITVFSLAHSFPLMSELTFQLLHSVCIHKSWIKQLVFVLHYWICHSSVEHYSDRQMILWCIRTTFTICLSACVHESVFSSCILLELLDLIDNIYFCVDTPQVNWWTCPVLSLLEMTHYTLCPVRCWRKHTQQWVEKQLAATA